MNRRSAIRTSLLAIAASLVPEILRGSSGEMEDEQQCLFDKDRLEETLRQYPLHETECYFLKKRTGGQVLCINLDYYSKHKEAINKMWPASRQYNG